MGPCAGSWLLAWELEACPGWGLLGPVSGCSTFFLAFCPGVVGSCFTTASMAGLFLGAMAQTAQGVFEIARENLSPGASNTQPARRTLTQELVSSRFGVPKKFQSSRFSAPKKFKGSWFWALKSSKVPVFFGGKKPENRNFF